MYLYFVNFKFRHHGKHSGYDNLINYFPNAFHISGQNYETLIHWINKQNKYTRFALNKLLNNKRYWIEYYTLFKTPNSSSTIIHFLYPENQYRNFGKWKDKRKIVVTFHQPPEYFIDEINNKNNIERYRFIDKAIVVSKTQIPIVEKLVGKGKVVFIPHGVDTEFFKPDKKIYKDIDVLIVGNWLRDFNFARKVFKKLQNKNINIVVVSLKKNASYFNDLNNVKFFYNISDFDLLKIYQKSKILFLPIKNATANNALLEGMSCGLPIVSTFVEAIKEYIDNEGIRFVSFNEDEVIEVLLEILKNSKLRRKMGEITRWQAIQYSWNNISGKLSNLYKELL